MLAVTRVAISATALVCAAALPALAQAVKNIGTHNDWAVFADGGASHEFCFVTSIPTGSEPADASRSPPRAYISAWPKEGVRSEVSFRLGFPIDGKEKGVVDVDGDSFDVFATDDRAYIADATKELKLVDAMRKGTKLTVKVTSTRGTVVTDTYSLSGITAAMGAMQKTCF